MRIGSPLLDSYAQNVRRFAWAQSAERQMSPGTQVSTGWVTNPYDFNLKQSSPLGNGLPAPASIPR
ncbi:MAG TPA: hypothetical protein PK264_03590 [Hyphomicrobiaceae bacterium]|nr:hypothetical protein [Hyphomicrobiaceae bacterium]